MLQLFDSFRQLSFVSCMHLDIWNSNSMHLTIFYASMPVALNNCFSKLSKTDVLITDVPAEGVRASS